MQRKKLEDTSLSANIDSEKSENQTILKSHVRCTAPIALTVASSVVFRSNRLSDDPFSFEWMDGEIRK